MKLMKVIRKMRNMMNKKSTMTVNYDRCVPRVLKSAASNLGDTQRRGE
jgi:hypothetical protein